MLTVKFMIFTTLFLFALPLITFAVGKVVIYRDSYGVPHIYGDNEFDVLYGQGYTQAQDRLGTMMKGYRKAVGRMAEAFGDEWLEHDYYQRILGHEKISRQRYDTISPEVRKGIEAFIAGINAYIKEHPERIPEWALEIEPCHIIALSRFIIWNWPVGQALDDLEHREKEPDSGKGSNEWVIAKRLSAEDCVISLIDPHVPSSDEWLFFESHLHGGDLNAFGFINPGVPYIGLGHNDYLSWAMTTGGPDTSDIYEEEIDPENPLKYKYDNEWRDIEIEKVEIQVKTVEGIKTINREIHHTHHGPIVLREGNKAYSMKLPYRYEVQLPEQMRNMALSKNLGEFIQAVSMCQLMPQNLMYGDVYGNMYYVRTGRVPIRSEGYKWNQPVPGNTSKTEWLGIHDHQDLIQIINPPAGFMQNCNISPGTMTPKSPMTPDRYPDYIYDDEAERTNPRGSRFMQIMKELDGKVTKEKAIDIALDTKLHGVEAWQNALKTSYDSLSQEYSDLEKALNIIINWDCRADVDSIGMTIFSYWMYNSDNQLGLKNPPDNEQQNHLLKSLRQAVEQMQNLYGTIEVKWGEVHRAKRGDKSWEVAGIGHNGLVTLRAIGTSDPDDKGVRYVQSGQSCPTVIFLKQPVFSYSAVPYGQSEDPKSPHYTDQGENLFAKRKLKPTFYQKEELMKNLESIIELDIDLINNK
jgi:acyl-homoserine lactone acylase PvdQ